MNPQTRKLNYGLLKAVEHLNLEEVRRLLALGADVNFHSAHNLTPLIMAAMTEPDAPGGALSSADVAPEALEVMNGMTEAIDLVISDVVMPEMDGPTLLRELRRRQPKLRIIFMSGYAEDVFERHLPDAATFSFLPKPFSLKELATTVKATLEA